MDINRGVGVVGTLGGAAFGAVSGLALHRQQLRHGDRREVHRAKVDACVAFLVAFRQFRGYVQTARPDRSGRRVGRR